VSRSSWKRPRMLRAEINVVGTRWVCQVGSVPPVMPNTCALGVVANVGPDHCVQPRFVRAFHKHGDGPGPRQARPGTGPVPVRAGHGADRGWRCPRGVLLRAAGHLDRRAGIRRAGQRGERRAPAGPGLPRAGDADPGRPQVPVLGAGPGVPRDGCAHLVACLRGICPQAGQSPGRRHLSRGTQAAPHERRPAADRPGHRVHRAYRARERRRGRGDLRGVLPCHRPARP